MQTRSRSLLRPNARRGRLSWRIFQGIRLRSRARASSERFCTVGPSLNSGSLSPIKVALAGVPLILVDPRNTSRECSQCGHVVRENRQPIDLSRSRLRTRGERGRTEYSSSECSEADCSQAACLRSYRASVEFTRTEEPKSCWISPLPEAHCGR